MMIYVVKLPSGGTKIRYTLAEAQRLCGRRLRWHKSGHTRWWASGSRRLFYIHCHVLERAYELTGYCVMRAGDTLNVTVISDSGPQDLAVTIGVNEFTVKRGHAHE